MIKRYKRYSPLHVTGVTGPFRTLQLLQHPFRGVTYVTLASEGKEQVSRYHIASALEPRQNCDQEAFGETALGATVTH